MPVNTTLTIHVGGRMCSTTEKSSFTWTCDFPSLAPVLQKSGATCEDSSSQRTVSTADQSVCGENFCGKINMNHGIYEVHVVTEYRRFYVGCINQTRIGNRNAKDTFLNFSWLNEEFGRIAGSVAAPVLTIILCLVYVRFKKKQLRKRLDAQRVGKFRTHNA
ncbi:uncharacterized protein LOC112571887 [Pomacea canaliculata]|uniref:uncharacterized protein LOC112571887 n=1 Tax=Pomacea canaliculata TaxID=400727 RepID=UPI000D729D9C|nr:uncharacterized protein LOC112571887 [Pomacea canaliculata]